MKVAPIVDGNTREALAIVGARSLIASAVKAAMAEFFVDRGRPATLRSDDSPRCIAFELTEWLEGQGASTYHIETRNLWQNSSRFNNRLRDERLHTTEFWSVNHARVVHESWWVEYNTERLHSSLGYQTPEEFGA